MSEKARILIVDDEKHIRDSISELLIDNGYSIGTAASGEEALTKLKDESFDIALVDVKMPKMSGLQLLEKIKTDQPRVDLIMITGYATVNMAVESLKLGAYDFLQKPCDNNEMLASIKRLLNNRRLAYELKQVKYYHELILQSAGEGIIGIDLEGKQTFVNPAAAKKLGYEVVELIGQPSHTMWHHSKPDGTPYPKEECPIDAAYKDRTIYTWSDEVFWRKDGTSFPVRYTSTPILEDDKLLGTVIIFRDITEHKNAEEELQKAYQELKETYIQLTQASKLTAMGEMAAGVVHELTQPLLGIRGFSTALLEDMKHNLPTETPQQAIADLDVILQQTDRMMKILNMMREFARASGTEMSLLDINKPLEDALLLFSEFRINNIVVEKNLTRDLPPVMGNANQIQQVFINLIANARDALDAKDGGGRLEIKTGTSPADASILIEVVDNGIGADAETLSKMFNPFFTTKKAGSGTGLGLPIVARIVKEHKGTIDVQGKPGRGCKFSIRLPLSAK